MVRRKKPARVHEGRRRQEVTVTPVHCRELGYCMRSVRPWFDRHDLDFMDFVRNGIGGEKLLATNDEFARRIVKHVEGKTDGR